MTGRCSWRLLVMAPVAIAAVTCASEPAEKSCEELAAEARSTASARCSALPETVSLRHDVMPILGRACAFSSCHLDPGRPEGGLYLGPNVNNTGDEGPGDPFFPPRSSELAKVHASILSMSERAPQMARVVPGDPAGSFLQLKLDGLQGCAAVECFVAGEPADCGDGMPQNQPKLSACERQAVRRWIQEGAVLADACVADLDCARPPSRCCGGLCTDVGSDADHCGACDRACPAEGYCDAGQCRCALGLEACGAACVNKASDPLHCGACDVACPPRDGASSTCAKGECGYRCTPGRAECNADAADGCERTLAIGERMPMGCSGGFPVPKL